jgi:hypothetical protein
MPEILEERFRRAKSGLMLAPAKTQALAVSETAIVPRFRRLPIKAGSSQLLGRNQPHLLLLILHSTRGGGCFLLRSRPETRRFRGVKNRGQALKPSSRP